MTVGYTIAYRPTTDEVADVAGSGRDISESITNQGTKKQPVTRVNVDFTPDLLQELDELAAESYVNRQSAIESCLRQALDQHLRAKRRK